MIEILDEIQQDERFQNLSPSAQEEFLRIGGDILAETAPEEAESIYTDVVGRVSSMRLAPIVEQQEKRRALEPIEPARINPQFAGSASLDPDPATEISAELSLTDNEVPQNPLGDPTAKERFDPDLLAKFESEQSRIASSVQQKPFRPITTPSGKVVLGRQRFALSKYSEQGYEIMLKDGTRQFVNDAFNDEKLGQVADARYADGLDSNALALATRRAQSAESVSDLFVDKTFSSLSRTEKMAVLDTTASQAREKALNAPEDERVKYQRLANYAGQISDSMRKGGNEDFLGSAIEQFSEMGDQEMVDGDPWGIRKPLNIAKPFMQGLENTYKTRVKARLEKAQGAYQEAAFFESRDEEGNIVSGLTLNEEGRKIISSPEFAKAAEEFDKGNRNAFDEAGVWGSFLNSQPEGVKFLQKPEDLYNVYSEYADLSKEYAAAATEFKAAYLTTPDFTTDTGREMEKNGFFSAFSKDPVGLINQLFWSSQLTNPQYSVLTAAAGAGVARLPLSLGAKTLAFGGINAAVEFENDQATRFYETFELEAKSKGYDLTTPEGLDSAVSNPAVITAAGARARTGAMGVAFTGALGSGVSAKISTPMAKFWAKRGATNPRVAAMLTQNPKAVSALTQAGTQTVDMAFEMGGEALGQVMAGQEFNMDEVLAEGFAGHYSGFFAALNNMASPDVGVQAAINQVQLEASAQKVAQSYIDQAQTGAPEILPVTINRLNEPAEGIQRFQVMRGEEPIFEGAVHESAIDFLQSGAERLHGWMSGTYVINNEADRLVYYQNGQRQELTREGTNDFDAQAAEIRRLNNENQMEDDASSWQDVEAYQILETSLNDQVRLSANARAESQDRISQQQVRPVLDYLFQQDRAIAANMTNRFGLPIYTQDVARFRYLTNEVPVRGLSGRPTSAVQLEDGSTRYVVGRSTESIESDRPFYSGYIDQETYDRIQRFNDLEATNKRLQIRGNSIQFLYDEIATTEERRRIETEVDGDTRVTRTDVESNTVRAPAVEDSEFTATAESEAITTQPAENVRVTERETVRARRTTGRFENFSPASVSATPKAGNYLFQLPEQGDAYTLNDIDLSAGRVTDIRPFVSADSRVRFSNKSARNVLGSYAPNTRIVQLLRDANVSTFFEELDHDFFQNLAPLVLTSTQLQELERAISQYAASPRMRDQLAASRTVLGGRMVPVLARGSKTKPVSFALKNSDGLYTAASQEIFGYMMGRYRTQVNGIEGAPQGLNAILGQINGYYQQLFANLGGSPIANISVESRVLLDRFYAVPPDVRSFVFDTRQMRAQADQLVLASKSEIINLATAISEGTSYTPEPNIPAPILEEPMQTIEIVHAQGNPQSIPEALNHFGRTGPGTRLRPGEHVFMPDSGLSGTWYTYQGLTTLPDGSQRRTFQSGTETDAEINSEFLYGPEEISRDIRASLDNETAWAFSDQGRAGLRNWTQLHQAEILAEQTQDQAPNETPVQELPEEMLETEAQQTLALTDDGMATPDNQRGDLAIRTGNTVSLEAGDHIVIGASKELLRWNGPNDFQTWTGQGWVQSNYDPETMRALFDSGLARRYKQNGRGTATRTYNASTARIPKMFTQGSQGERLVTHEGFQYMIANGAPDLDAGYAPNLGGRADVRAVGQIQIDGPRDRPAFIATPFDENTAPVEFLSYSPERGQALHAVWKRRVKANHPMGQSESEYIQNFGSYEPVTRAFIQRMAVDAYNRSGGLLEASRQFYRYSKMSQDQMDQEFDPSGAYTDVGLAIVIAYSNLLRNDLASLMKQIENGVIPQPDNMVEIRALHTAVMMRADKLGTSIGRALGQFPSEINPDEAVKGIEASIASGSRVYRRVLRDIDAFREKFGRASKAKGLEDAMRDFGIPVNPPTTALVRQFLSFQIKADAFSTEMLSELIKAKAVPTLTETEKRELSEVAELYQGLQNTPVDAPAKALLLQSFENKKEQLKGIDLTKLFFEVIHKNRLLFKPTTLVINLLGPVSQVPLTILSQWAYLTREGRRRGWTTSAMESALSVLSGTLKAFSPGSQDKALNAALMTSGGFRTYNSSEIEKNINYSAASAAFLVGISQEEFAKMPGYQQWTYRLARFMAYQLTQTGGRISTAPDGWVNVTGQELAFVAKLQNEAVSAWYDAGNPGDRGSFVQKYVHDRLTFEVNGVRTPFAIENYERLAEAQMAQYGDVIMRNSTALFRGEKSRNTAKKYLAYAIRQSVMQDALGEWYDSVSEFGLETAMAQQLPPILQTIDNFAHDMLSKVSFKGMSGMEGNFTIGGQRFRIGEGSALAPFGLLFITFPLRALDKFLRFFPPTGFVYATVTAMRPDVSIDPKGGVTRDKKIRTGIDFLSGTLMSVALSNALGSDMEEETWLDALLKLNPFSPIEKIRATGAQAFTWSDRKKQYLMNPFSIYVVGKERGGERTIQQYPYVEYPQLAALIGPAMSSREYFRNIANQGDEAGASDYAATQVLSLMIGLGIGFEKVSPGESIKKLVDMISTVEDVPGAKKEIDYAMLEFLKSFANPLSNLQREGMAIVRGFENSYDPKDVQARLYANSFFEGLIADERLAPKRNPDGSLASPRMVARFNEVKNIPSAVYWMASNDLYPPRSPGSMTVEDVFEGKKDKNWAKNNFQEVNNGMFYLAHLKEADFESAKVWQNWVTQYSQDESRTETLKQYAQNADNILAKRRENYGEYKTLKELQQQDINAIVGQARDIAGLRILAEHYTQDKAVKEWLRSVADGKEAAGYTLDNRDKR